MAKGTFFITFCSRSGLSDALAREFYKRNLLVFATGRNPAKIDHFKSTGIETLPFYVLSEASIQPRAQAVAAKTSSTLDIPINNSGGCYSAPLADTSVPKARALFDLNVFTVRAATQTFCRPC